GTRTLSSGSPGNGGSIPGPAAGTGRDKVYGRVPNRFYIAQGREGIAPNPAGIGRRRAQPVQCRKDPHTPWAGRARTRTDSSLPAIPMDRVAGIALSCNQNHARDNPTTHFPRLIFAR